MKSGALATWSRWLLVVPVAFFASGAAAWVFSLVAGISNVEYHVSGPTTLAENIYEVAADIIYGWVLVSAGTATAPIRRSAIAVALFCLLLVAMGYFIYNYRALGPGVTPMWMLLRLVGYVAGAAIAVRMVFVKYRREKPSESPQ